MTQNMARVNLSAASIPFLTELLGETVILSGIDQEQEIPQIYYAHNVMPSKQGVTSVSYGTLVTPPPSSDGLFESIYILRDSDENVCSFAPISNGKNYVWLTTSGGWTQTTTLGTPAVDNFVTTAHINGETYIYLKNVGCYLYDFGTNALVSTALTGLTATDIIGITTSSGYLIAWDETAIYWSSLVDPTDFVPSLVTGAGSESIQEAKAAISCVLPVGSGIVVYTKRNAVSATYSGNTAFPWTYKEISGAGGLSNPSQVAYEGNSLNHTSYTTAGFQDVSLTNATAAFPELTDFIAGSLFEDFNELTNEWTRIELSAPMQKKIVVVGNRYIVVSYGVTALTHAVVWDSALRRWGKLKLPHVDCFEYVPPSSDVVEIPRRAIAFLQADGTIYNVILSYSVVGSYGTLIAGRYQLDRNHFLSTQEIHLKSIRAGNELEVYLINEIEGEKEFVDVTLATSTADYRRYNSRASGINQSVVITGGFQLNTLLLRFSDEGEIR